MLDKKVFAELEGHFSPYSIHYAFGKNKDSVCLNADRNLSELKLLQLFMLSDGYIDESEQRLYDRFCETIEATEATKNKAREYASSIPDVDSVEWILREISGAEKRESEKVKQEAIAKSIQDIRTNISAESAVEPALAALMNLATAGTIGSASKEQKEDKKYLFDLYYDDDDRLFLLWRLMLQMAYADGKCSTAEMRILDQVALLWGLKPIVCAALEDMERTNQLLWLQKRWLASEAKAKEGIQFIDERLERLKHDFAVTCSEYKETAVLTETSDSNEESK